VVGFLIIVGVMAGVVVAGNEASKEQHIKGNQMVGLDNKQVTVGVSKKQQTMFDLAHLPIEELAVIEQLFIIPPAVAEHSKVSSQPL